MPKKTQFNVGNIVTDGKNVLKVIDKDNNYFICSPYKKCQPYTYIKEDGIKIQFLTDGKKIEDKNRTFTIAQQKDSKIFKIKEEIYDIVDNLGSYILNDEIDELRVAKELLEGVIGHFIVCFDEIKFDNLKG